MYMSEGGHHHIGSTKPGRRRWSLIFQSRLGKNPQPVVVGGGVGADDIPCGESDDRRCCGGGGGGGGSNGNDDITARPTLDLESCISIIESVGDVVGLTPIQRDAIRDLRSNIIIESSSRQSSSPRIPNNNDAYDDDHQTSRMGMCRSIARRRGESFLDVELTRCVREMADNVDDDDGHRHVSDILANYGGQFVNSFLRKVGRESRREGGGRRNPVGSIGPIGVAVFDSYSRIDRTSDEWQAELRRYSDSHDEVVPTRRRRSSNRRDAFVSFSSGLIPREENERLTSSIGDLYNDDNSGIPSYCPPEWNALNRRTRTRLTNLLSWDNLAGWEFDIVAVSELSQDTMNDTSSKLGFRYGQCCPLLLVGWAILCAPMAQRAMEGSLGDNVDTTLSAAACQDGPGGERKAAFPYPFSDLNIDPECVCNFLREVEGRYASENFYHNNLHAADVVQTLHCLLQFIGEENLFAIYDPLDVFSLLLAATFHDVGHPGFNNLYHKNARTELAIVYNDASILENMHSAVGHSLLLGETKEKKWDIFQQFDDRQIERARSVMISAVLGTDMGNHFEFVGTLAEYMENVRVATSSTSLGLEKGLPILAILVRVLGSENKNVTDEPLVKGCIQLANGILKFLLHAADISNPAKKLDLARFWADRALKEFFVQGDAEKELGLPISPLCDRSTVKKTDSQIGFLKFVVRPTYMLLGEILPRVKEEVLPIIDEQIKYWLNEKASTWVSNSEGGVLQREN
ncbi:hypothetical protein ACHAXA_007850 [Cyclostephanos tholiformis]|uniref:Phosphodiesterase n=1 Tax=Cyclostephanos tholiformis TaxID=382380 RepID=A0ABD3SC90_9STRA